MARRAGHGQRRAVIVRRPAAARDFSGTVVVEWFNVSAIEASPDWAHLSQEIGRALQYFFTSTPHHKVHYVMLAGGTATLPGLKDRVTDLTGFASMVVNPFDGMKIGMPRSSDARLDRRSLMPGSLAWDV